MTLSYGRREASPELRVPSTQSYPTLSLLLLGTGYSQLTYSELMFDKNSAFPLVLLSLSMRSSMA